MRREHALQAAVAHMLEVVLDPERTWWSSIDHGVGYLGKRTAFDRKKRGVKPGLPDIIILRQPQINDWAHMLIGIELKVKNGKLSEVQRDVGDAWSKMGHTIFVARSLEEVQEILEFCRVPMRTRMRFFSGGNNEPVRRSQVAGHSRPRRTRKPKNHLPLVQSVAAQKD